MLDKILYSGYFWFLSFIIVVIVLIKRISKPKTYWTDLGVDQIGKEVTGNLFSNLYNKVKFFDIDTKVYKKIKELNKPYAGLYEFGSPSLILQDLDLIKLVLVKDFNHFVNRKGLNVPKDGLNNVHFHKMLFNMQSEEWKQLRVKITPTFTTGKIRRMFSIFDNCAQKLVEYYAKQIEISNELDVSEGVSKFTLDIIASSAFGVESGAFEEKKSLFEKMADKLQFKITIPKIIQILTMVSAPKLANLIGLRIFDAEADDFFTHMVKKNLKYREEKGSKRQDFLQLMIDAKNERLKVDENEEEIDSFEKDAIDNLNSSKSNDSTLGSLVIDDDTIVANSMLFMLAGYETTASLLFFAAYQLALCPEIQTELFQEIKTALDENDQEFSYDNISKMELLDKVVNETLRLYPPAARLDRKCTMDYKFPNTNWTLKKDQTVVIPTMAIQRDSEIYPDPEKFDPERWSPENKAARHPYAFLAWGHGGRSCIGMRFALMSKLAIAHVIKNFVLEPCHKTDIPLQFMNTASLKPTNGIWLKMTTRK